jgi:hypothetical protein
LRAAGTQVLWSNAIGGSIPTSLGSLTSLSTLCVCRQPAARTGVHDGGAARANHPRTD